jgi:long-chain acyl-CoA synthetase
MFHMQGLQALVNTVTYLGSTVVLLPRWDAARAAALIAEHRVSRWGVAPPMLLDLLALPGLKPDALDSVAVITGGGSALPEAVNERLTRELGIRYMEAYGMTESTGMGTAHKTNKVVAGTVGPVTQGVEYRIAAGGDDGSGELQIRGEMVFAGYYKNPEASAQSIQDGWLHTGDVVREVDGQIKIVDRLKDIMITAGGKNLTPSEIENAMKASPYIKECVIVAEGRKFVGALVMSDYETVGKWAEAQRLSFTHFRSLVETPQVRQLIDSEIATGNAKLAKVAQIRKFHLLTKELDHDDGEVTATMKVRRSSIYKTYATEIEALYH